MKSTNDPYPTNNQNAQENKKPEEKPAENNEPEELKSDEIKQIKEAKEKANPLEQIVAATKSKEENFRIFWDTQPVPKMDYYNDLKADTEKPLEGEPIDEIKKVDQVRQTPFPLPDIFEWVELDISVEEVIQKVYELLTENYVEDEDNMFRFDYSKDFLRWALMPPGFYKDWIFGCRYIKSGKLIGFITGIPVHIMAGEKKIKMAEINFLCVHKKVRQHRLAPVLIKEVTRRVNLRNIWQAIYTAGVVVPSPISEARYYHRSLNPKKLIESNFSSLGKNQTLSRVVKLFKLPEDTTIQGIRPMKNKDIAGVHKLLNDYLKRFKVYSKYTEEDVKHIFVPRPKVIYSYVVESGKDKEKKITDFLSFYSLPSSIIKNPKHKTLNAAYSFYNVATSVSLKELTENALILAQKEGFDVYNALDIMENGTVFNDLKFSPGDGNLHYYFYNLRLNRLVAPGELGIVLV